ncbi:MAG: LTA synthase family protein [Clostridiales Family XIII bacterium]|jgi:phosphoglycerol transferase MdoB-like AlkP superfamily enzyme|nr:LTA synthase family protein [Clostridiales Family XIII bacterium]
MEKEKNKKTKEERKEAHKKKREARKARTPEEKYGKFVFLYTIVHKVIDNRVFRSPLAQACMVAFFLLLVIEGFEYKNPVGGFLFLFKNPFAFLLNMLTIFTTLTIAWLFRRKGFVYVIISVVWLALGITNGVVLMNRMTPFTTADLQILDMGIDILPTYFSRGQMVFLVAAIVFVLALFVLFFIFGPKKKERPNYKRVLPVVLLSFVILFGGWQIGTKSGALATYFENLWDAYYAYGVPYCFISTWINTGVSKPKGYSEEMVEQVFEEGALSTMSSKEGKTADDYPNIVFLQLESFIDPSEVKTLEFSGDAVPFYRSLKEEYSSGYLQVPVVGGGTSNTEFEVMSGMSLHFFGPGEYPYKTILQEHTCETMAYNVKRFGFATHAIHNHRGVFYNRNLVFKNLGFDDFTSLEYMNYVSKTPKNFARDDVLIGEILGAMEATETKDYVYAISVQGHGKYPSTKTIEHPKFTVKSEMTEEQRYGWEYYLEQISEMDDFLRQLTEELENYDEDIVLVLYGDHLPVLDLMGDQMKAGTTYKTQYVIWSNYDLKKDDKDLAAYQLSAEVQKRIGMREGTLTVYHQDEQESTDYLENLHLLQYDMLYGKEYIYAGKSPFEPTAMKMDYQPIVINEVVKVGSQYYIKGEGFTPFSKVSLDGKILDTRYMSPDVLKLMEAVSPLDADKMKVSQVEKYDAVLSTTE